MSDLAKACDQQRLVYKLLQKTDLNSAATCEELSDYGFLFRRIIRLSGSIARGAQFRLLQSDDDLHVIGPKSNKTEHIPRDLTAIGLAVRAADEDPGDLTAMIQALSAADKHPRHGGSYPMSRLGKACDILRRVHQIGLRISPIEKTCLQMLLHCRSELLMVISLAKCINRLASDLLKSIDDELNPPQADVDDDDTGNTGDDYRYEHCTPHD